MIFSSLSMERATLDKGITGSEVSGGFSLLHMNFPPREASHSERGYHRRQDISCISMALVTDTY